MKILNPRRFVSGLLLFLALTMLVLGLTLFGSDLHGKSFLVYWSICFLMTGIAAITAVVEMTLLRHKLRKEQRELIQSALDQVRPEEPNGPTG